MVNSILIVCSGNICRSPLAKVLLEQYLPHIAVDSAGLDVDVSGLAGREAAAFSRQIAAQQGLDLKSHQAKQLTAELVAQYDLILVMSHDHVERIATIACGARGKTILIGQWIGVGDVVDPIGQDYAAFSACFSIINKALLSWKKKLN